MANPFDQFDVQETAVKPENPFDVFDSGNRLDNVTIEDINRKNQNPGNKEFFFVPGRNVNVELPKGGVNKAWNFLRRSYGSGKDQVELGTLASGVVFGKTSSEIESRISTLEKKTATPDPLLGILPPPEEGWVDYIADTIANQIPNLAGMMHDGLEAGLGAGITTMAAAALAGPAAPALAPLVPISFGAGFATGSLNFAFNQIAGSSYLEYRNFTDKEGNKLPDGLAKLGAVMSGVVGTGLEALPFGMLAKIMPGAHKIFSRAGIKVTEALKFPTTTQAMKTFLFNIAKVAIAEGTTESLQEVVQIETGEALKAFTKGEFEPVSTEEMWARIQEAGLKGAIVGGAVSIPVAGARVVADVAQGPKLKKQGVETVEPKEVTGAEKAGAQVLVTPETIIETVKEIETIVADIETKGTPEEISQARTETIAKINETLKDIAPSPEAVDTIIQGRIDKLDTDINSIDKEIDNTEREIVQRKLNKQPTKALENKTVKLLNQREVLDTQRAELLTASEQISAASKLLTEKDIVAREAQKEIIEVKAEKIVKLEEQSLKAQERALATGLRQGARTAKTDIKQAIKNIKQLIRSTSLPKDTKDAIIAQFVTGEQDFIKNIPRLKSKIATEFERLAAREQKARINKALSRKAIKPRVVSGVKQGKFDAQIQEELNNLRTLNNTSGKVNPDTGESEASRLLDERIEKGIDDPIGNAILNAKANPRVVTSSELKQLADNLDILTSEGREAAKARVLKRQIEAQNLANSIVEFVSKDQNVKTIKTTGIGAALKSTGNFTRQVVARLTDAWNDILDRILPESIAKELEIGAEIQIEKGIKRRMSNNLTKAAEISFGIKDGRKLRNILENSNEVKDYGIFTNAKNEEVRIEMSVSQGRKLFMEWQDPTLRETLTSKDGNAYTQEMLTYVFNSILTEQDRQFALEQLSIYAEFYNEINEVYSRVFGINLDKNEFYSPIRREVDAQEIGLDEFGRDQGYRAKVANNPSLKIRQKNVQPILLRSDLSVYNRHVTAMSRFIALREKTQLLNNIFGKREVRRNLEAQYGKDFNLFIGQHLESFVNGGNMAGDVLSIIINELNRNFAAAALGLKAKIGFTQLVSYFAYAETIPVSAFISGTRDFFFNMPTAIRTLSQSELIKARGWSQEVEIARMGKVFDSEFVNKIRKRQDKMIDYMLMATKVGDRIPIFVGGWAVYSHVLKKTGSKVRAMEAFNRQTASTQQSTDPDQLSLQQKNNPLMRGLTMFMSAPMAQFRGEVRAIRKWRKGEINNRQLAKNILIYHFILPGLYQAIANGIVFGEWDKEDQIRAAILGSFNGIPIIGDILNGAFRVAQGKSFRGLEILKWAAPLVEMSGDLFDALKLGIEGDFEELTHAIMDAFKNSGALTGLPAPQIDNIKRGFQELEDGDLKSSTLRFLGWPDSVIRNID